MRKSARTSLHSLIQQYGIQRTYRAADGKIIRADDEAARAVIDALEAGGSRQDGDPVAVAWDGVFDGGAIQTSYEIRTEDGTVIAGRGLTAKRHRLPLGYHELHAGATRTTIIAAPRRCHAGDRARAWGVFAPLYAIRENRDKPIGDFSDLEAVMRWVGEAGGDFVATLPISAAFLDEPFDPSPYSPASRLFWNELYLDPEGPGFTVAERPISLSQQHGAGDLVDYHEVAEQKRSALGRAARRFFDDDGERSAEFRAFLELYPDAPDYAHFRAQGENSDERYHLFAQFASHQQLTRLAETARASGVNLYLDLPLGVHPDSYDVQHNPSLFVMGLAVGAPPDSFFTQGQNWGFPPLHPQQLREQRYAYWRQVLQTQLRYAGVLRLDHIMGLHRLYVVPDGLETGRGVYLCYPHEEMYAVLTLESVRHKAVIVGEDLGTVPAAVRQAMARHAVKRMFVVQFEAREDAKGIEDAKTVLPPIPKEAVASLNTHDMPTFRAYWEGLDADLRRELGLLDDDGVRETRANRERTTTALSHLLGSQSRLDTEAAHAALIRFLSASDAAMLLLNLEDMWLEAEPQNVPGTTEERPNWRRRLKYTIDEMRGNPEVRGLLEEVCRSRS